MEDRPFDQSTVNASPSAASGQTPGLPNSVFAFLGFLLGCIPVGLCLVFWGLGSLVQFSWGVVVLLVYLCEGVGVAFLWGTSHKPNARSLMKGIIWGMGVTGGLAICTLLSFVVRIFTH